MKISKASPLHLPGSLLKLWETFIRKMKSMKALLSILALALTVFTGSVRAEDPPPAPVDTSALPDKLPTNDEPAPAAGDPAAAPAEPAAPAAPAEAAPKHEKKAAKKKAKKEAKKAKHKAKKEAKKAKHKAKKAAKKKKHHS